jgi:hypothetical protein
LFQLFVRKNPMLDHDIEVQVIDDADLAEVGGGIDINGA